jgi:hypothetical protein
MPASPTPLNLERLRPIKRAAQGRLMALPGVHAVGIGIKKTGGQRTGEPAIVVFVEHKRPAADLPASQRIPAQVGGVMTDVVECEMPRVCVDDKKRRPLVGGSRLQPGGLTEGFVRVGGTKPVDIPGSGLGQNGTIGCLVRTGEAVPRILALTCQHVVGLPSEHRKRRLIGAALPDNKSVQFGGNAGAGGFVVLRICPPGQICCPPRKICRPPQKDSLNVFYGVGPGDDLNAVAAAVAARINGLSIAGVTAAADGPTVRLGGTAPTELDCQVFDGRVENTWSGIKTTVKDRTITLSGRAKGRCAAFVTLNRGGPHPTEGAFTPIAEDASAQDIAAVVAAAINARAIKGVSAKETGAVVTVTGVQHLECDISSDLRMGQPTNSFPSRCSKCCDDRIGTVVEARIDVDAALIELDAEYVEEYRADVQDVGNVKGVNDVHRLFSSHKLKVRGANTGKVQHGILGAVDISGLVEFIDPLHGDQEQWHVIHRYFTQAFEIEGTGEEVVSAGGDSGAVVLTDEPSGSNDEVVGLLFGGGKKPVGNQTRGLATPIQQVIAAFPTLKLTIETATQPGVDRPVPAAAPAQHGPEAQPVADLALLSRLQSELTATPAGRHYSQLIQRHFAEGQRLVNHNRRVALAWHRNGGPSIAQSVVRMSESAAAILPREIDGRPLADCLARIGRAFARHGSAELAADVAAWGPPLAGLAGLDRAQAIDALSCLQMR